MQTNIGHSIQEYCKKINREIDGTLILGLFLALLIIIGFTGYLVFVANKKRIPIVYKVSSDSGMSQVEQKSTIFASKSGQTYTFSWCKGASKIKESNRIYFTSEDDARSSGKRLSKLCN